MLSPKHLRFCQEYAIDHNASQAYVRAGYSDKGAGPSADRLLKKANVKAEIAKLDAENAEKLGLSAEKVLKGIAQLAFFDIRKLYREDGSLKEVIELDDDTQAAICGIEVEKLYENFGKGQAKDIGKLSKVKLCDRGINLERLGRHFKLFTDKIEHTGVDALAEEIQKARLRAQK